MSILGASSDGSVALLRNETEELVVHHSGAQHALSKDLTGVTGYGVVAPDGRRILLQREDRDDAIVIDAATRRPLARLEIVAGAFVFNWRTA